MNNLTKIEKDTFEIHDIAAEHDLTNQSIDEIERISPTNFDVPIWMTVREFSDLTGVKLATVYQRITRGTIKTKKGEDGTHRIHRGQIGDLNKVGRFVGEKKRRSVYLSCKLSDNLYNDKSRFSASFMLELGAWLMLYFTNQVSIATVEQIMLDTLDKKMLKHVLQNMIRLVSRYE